MRAQVVALLAALFGFGLVAAPAAHAESIINQFVAGVDQSCDGSTFHLSTVIQVTDLVRYRSTYYRAQVTSGSDRIKWFNFRSIGNNGSDVGYYGPAVSPGTADTGSVFDPSRWNQNPPFRVYGAVELWNGVVCPEVLIYGP